MGSKPKLKLVSPSLAEPDSVTVENGWTEDALDLLKRRFFEAGDTSIRDWAWNTAAAFVRGYQDEPARIWHERYFELLFSRRFFPTTAALKNGRKGKAPLSGCTVLPLTGSLSELFSRTLPSALEALSSGIGVGLDLTPLLPRLSRDPDNERPSPGPVEMMRGIAQLASGVTKYNGLKRAAFMASLRYDHPDIFEFIKMKCSRPLDAINISVAIDDRFAAALARDEFLALCVHGKPYTQSILEIATIAAESRNVEAPDLGVLGDGRITSQALNGRVVGKIIDGTINIQASRILEAAAESAHACGDPGLINLSAINAQNPTLADPGLSSEAVGVGTIQTTTPCGEQPLLPHEVCHLGSLNLAAFTDGDKFLWDDLAATVPIAVRMLDDIIDRSESSTALSNTTSLANRKIGLGIMGLADVLATHNIPYDSEKGRAFASEIVTFINSRAIEASVSLAAERGAFPNWEISSHSKMPSKRRHATVTTIAPTGHISTLAGCSPGIEPYFSLHYRRKAVGERTVSCVPLEAYLNKVNFSLDKWIIATRRANPRYSFNGSLEGLTNKPTGVEATDCYLAKAKEIFKTALQISGRDHLKMLTALQMGVENGISKTINLPNSASIHEIYQIFKDAIQLSLKGITIFRDGSLGEQALTVTKGCASCGAVVALERNECGGYVCSAEKGGCGFAVCEI